MAGIYNKNIPVVCNETGELYSSGKDAATYLGLDPGNVCRNLKGSLKQVGGYTFSYVNEGRRVETDPKVIRERLDKRNLYTRNWRKANKYYSNRKKKDPAFKFIVDLRTRQGKVLKGKASTTAGLGCNSQELCDYLSGLFQPGMTFDNHGRGEGCWHMDHIIPLSSHEKDSNGDWDSESQYNKQLIHYTNLQPLWEQENLDKSNKIISYENTSNPSIRSNN